MTPESVLTPEFARSLVRRATLRTGSALCDDDLIQDALLRGLTAFRREAHVSHPRAFFARIVRDAVHDHWRRRRTLIPIDTLPERTLAVRCAIDDTLDRDWRLQQLREALAHLPLHHRHVIEMFYLDGMSVDRIARSFGKSHSAIKMILLRSRRRILALMAVAYRRH